MTLSRKADSKKIFNADSLDLFELIMSLEEEYSTEIPTDELENLPQQYSQ